MAIPPGSGGFERTFLFRGSGREVPKPPARPDAVQKLQEKLAYEQKLVELGNRIHAARSLDSIFIELHDEILELLDAERMTLYAVDHEKKELYSKFLALDSVKEIRVPISEKSIAGYVALTRQMVNIADAYNEAELARISPTLAFDSSWDEKTSFRTTHVLAAPILGDQKTILGVIQLLNKKHGLRFTEEDEVSVARIGRTLGIAFQTQYQLAQKRPTKSGALEAADAPEETDAAAGLEVDEADSAVARLANQIIVDAYKARASDIHIEPYGPQKDTVIRFRVDGSCTEYLKVPPAYRRAIVARLKVMAQLDIAERRKPQDGKIKFRMPEREIELRVATVPTAGGNEDVVMRLLAASEPIPIDKLGMTERNLRELKHIAEKPYGLILVVGPTGSGKTTTLHSVLGYINKPDRKIWTAEDPVEITQYGLRQVQVNPKIGFTFAAATRAFLRADPDVVMVGEMRDAETAATGIEASLTGHLVFSTLHTNSAVETVIRLLDMGMEPFNFADALLGVLAQRLVKRICSDCKETYHPSRDDYDVLARAYEKEEFETIAKYDNDFVLYRGTGCSNCNHTGYRGRASIHELLIASDEIKKLIRTKARVAKLLAPAKEEGMTTLVQDGVLKSLSGVTDFKQVKAVAIK